jgi:hypothetical protein
VPFNATLDRHLSRACDTFEIEADEIVSILGENYFMTTVWGSAFEDFLTQETDGGDNIVDDYLKRRGWKESASNRAYMQALRHSVVSLYEVSNIVPETSFLARDLVRGGEAVLINDSDIPLSQSSTHLTKCFCPSFSRRRFVVAKRRRIVPTRTRLHFGLLPVSTLFLVTNRASRLINRPISPIAGFRDFASYL